MRIILIPFPILLVILITVGARIKIFLYCKHKNVPACSKTLSLFWHRENLQETKPILIGSHPKIKEIPVMVKEESEMIGIDFFDFDKSLTSSNGMLPENLTITLKILIIFIMVIFWKLCSFITAICSPVELT